MRKLLVILLLISFVGVVSAIECSEADYDEDGDVDFMDVFQLRQCVNLSVSDVSEVNCSFFDYDGSGMVEENDLVLYREWHLQTCPVDAVCTDSDGGEDYYVKGNVLFEGDSGSQSVIYDQCVFRISDNKQILSEGICVDGEYDSIAYECLTGCEDGACVSESNESSTCQDSDGGKDYYIRGEITSDMNQGFDECNTNGQFGANPNLLREYYCNSENEIDVEWVTCTGSCESGRCVNGSEIVQGCKDTDNGIDYFNKGTASNSTYKETDHCTFVQNEDYYYIYEVYCDGNLVKSLQRKCDNGCEDGACVVDEDEVGNGGEIEEDENYPISPSPDGTIDDTDCDNGCVLKDKCYSFGYRKAMNSSLRYCEDNGEWRYQMEGEISCQNNFECESNV